VNNTTNNFSKEFFDNLQVLEDCTKFLAGEYSSINLKDKTRNSILSFINKDKFKCDKV
jgi:hypothetical protein